MFSRDDTFKNAEMRHFCCKRKSSHLGIAKELKEQHGLLLSKYRGLEKVLVGLGDTEVEENTLLSLFLPTADSNDRSYGSCILSFLRKLHSFPQWLHQLTAPTAVHRAPF